VGEIVARYVGKERVDGYVPGHKYTFEGGAELGPDFVVLSGMVPPEAVPEVQVTDAAAALAKANQLNLSSVTGTGKDGSITVGDVRRAVQGAGIDG